MNIYYCFEVNKSPFWIFDNMAARAAIQNLTLTFYLNKTVMLQYGGLARSLNLTLTLFF